MFTLKRPGKPDIHYVVDDYTDPWKKAPVILLQHGFARSQRVWFSWVPYLSRFYKVVRADATCAQEVLHFAAQHDGLPCREA